MDRLKELKKIGYFCAYFDLINKHGVYAPSSFLGTISKDDINLIRNSGATVREFWEESRKPITDEVERIANRSTGRARVATIGDPNLPMNSIKLEPGDFVKPLNAEVVYLIVMVDNEHESLVLDTLTEQGSYLGYIILPIRNVALIGKRNKMSLEQAKIIHECLIITKINSR